MSERLTLKRLLAKYHPALRRAFLAATQDIVDRAQIRRIAEALENGDADAAIAAVNLDPAAFARFEREVQIAYEEGGLAAVQELGTIRDQQGRRVVFRFSGRNFRAEEFLRQNAGDMVRAIVEEQRNQLRSVLIDGMAEGKKPRTVALDIVGRQTPNGRRSGGIVGLAPNQIRAVEAARRELESGEFSAFKQRTKRDRRYDRTLDKAAREGRPLTQAQIKTMVGRYSDRLLKARGDMIGRTEALRSIHAGNHEALVQLVETGKVRADQIRRTWDSAGDLRVRFSHAVMDGDSVGLNEAFTSPRGAQLMYPGDPSAPAEETINCRCVVRTRIDYRPNR